jgi:hypothetical protein
MPGVCVSSRHASSLAPVVGRPDEMGLSGFVRVLLLLLLAPVSLDLEWRLTKFPERSWWWVECISATGDPTYRSTSPLHTSSTSAYAPYSTVP